MKDSPSIDSRKSSNFLENTEGKDGNLGLSLAPPPFAISANPIQQKAVGEQDPKGQVNGRKHGKGVNDHFSISDQGLGFIIKYEGSNIVGGKHVLYDDPINYATIGYGHLVAPKKVALLTEEEKAAWINGLTEAEALALMRQDCQAYEKAIKEKVLVELQQHEFDSLITWLFNVGIGWSGVGGHEQASLIKNINADEFGKVGNNMGQFQKADGAFSQGILNRRNSEINIFNYGYGGKDDPYRSKGEFKAPMGADQWKEDYWGKHLEAHSDISKLGETPKASTSKEEGKGERNGPAEIWMKCGEDAAKTAAYLSPMFGKNDGLIGAMLDFLAWKQDNFAFHLVRSKSIDSLKQVGLLLLIRLRSAMDSGWTDEEDYRQIGKIDLVLGDRAHEINEANQRKEQAKKDQTNFDLAQKVPNKSTPLMKSVGVGGINDPSDVKMVKDRLLELQIITPKEHATNNAALLVELIKRYQRRVLVGKADGLISPSGTTANRLVQGIKGVAKSPDDELATVLAAERSKKQDELGTVKDDGVAVSKLYESAGGDATKIGIVMADYLRNNPKVVNAMLDLVGSDADTMTNALVLAVDTASIGSADKTLLRRLYDILDEGYTSYGDYAMMARLEPYLETERKGVASSDWNFESLELDVKKYWQSQGSTANCDIFTKKVIDGHKKDNPGLYKEFGDIGGNKTEQPNSLHTVWEKDHEKGTSRVSGQKGANETSTLIQDEGEWDLAIRYIIACLNAGIPAMVGVNHTFAYARAASNNDKTTDHWLTIIGKGSDQKGPYFTYTDPGTSHQDVGTNSENNRLYQKSDPYIWRDDSKYANSDGGAGAGSYTLVAVTLYDQHRGKSEFKVGSETFKRKI